MSGHCRGIHPHPHTRAPTFAVAHAGIVDRPQPQPPGRSVTDLGPCPVRGIITGNRGNRHRRACHTGETPRFRENHAIAPRACVFIVRPAPNEMTAVRSGCCITPSRLSSSRRNGARARGTLLRSEYSIFARTLWKRSARRTVFSPMRCLAKIIWQL